MTQPFLDVMPSQIVSEFLDTPTICGETCNYENVNESCHWSIINKIDNTFDLTIQERYMPWLVQEENRNYRWWLILSCVQYLSGDPYYDLFTGIATSSKNIFTNT